MWQKIIEGLESCKNPTRAASMEKYMKNKFFFYGVTSPERAVIVKEIHARLGIKSLDKTSIEKLWESPFRECQYAAMDHMKRYKKQLVADDFPWILSLITRKSWWDTVDFLAVHAIGGIAAKYEAVNNNKIEPLVHSSDIWLNRTAIIYQLSYKQKTDFDRLCRYILMFLGSKEFFINKASGWALREYAKTNPLAVKQFVEATPELSGLTKREALKHQG